MRWLLLVAVGCSLFCIALTGCGRSGSASLPPSPAPPPGPMVTETANTVAGATAPVELEGELVVGAPCGIAMPYKEVRDLFVAEHPSVKFVDHVKNIGPMVREVRAGKVRLDVFLSLGEREIMELTEAGLIQGKPTPFLKQPLQMIVRLGNPLHITHLEDLGSSKVRTVAVCEPSLSIGHASEQALRAAGVWETLEAEGKLVRPDQPMKAKGMVFEGKADAAFIYGACSAEAWSQKDPERSVVGKADVVLTVPEELHGGLQAVGAVLMGAAEPELARAFVEFLLSPAAQSAFEKLGYGKASSVRVSAEPVQS